MAKLSRSNIRQKTVNAALGSVRAEGLTPSQEVQNDLRDYTEGNLDIALVRAKTICRLMDEGQKIGDQSQFRAAEEATDELTRCRRAGGRWFVKS